LLVDTFVYLAVRVCWVVVMGLWLFVNNLWRASQTAGLLAWEDDWMGRENVVV